MKKKILFLVCVVLCFSTLVGCNKKEEEVIVSNDTVNTEVVEEKVELEVEKEENVKPESNKEIDENKTVLEEDELKVDKSIFERIDGSTATIPLSESLSLKLFGDEASDVKITHNTTSLAYERLLSGEVDLIFVTPPSVEEQEKLDKSSDVSFEIEKFAKEGFVFLVNENNKVDNLSIEDIQKIYKGEVKNWKDFGGEDANIKAYQRSENSGSQTLMYKLIGSKNEIADNAEIEVVPTMGGLVEAVASYDSGKDAIGYSVYYYINDMIGLGGSKLLSVNNVEPSFESIKDGSYPLVDGYYMVYNANLKADDDIYKIINYLRSEDGKKLIEDAGYIAVE